MSQKSPLTLGETALMSSFKNLYFPISLWNLLPQFFMHASSTCNEMMHKKTVREQVTNICTHALTAENDNIIPLKLAVPPIPEVSGFYEWVVSLQFVV